MSETESMGVTAEELDDLAWALVEMFPEVAREVSPVHNQEFWQAKATQLLPVVNKIRDRARAEGAVLATEGVESLTVVVKEGDYGQIARDEGKEITLDEALEKRHEGD